MLDDELRPEKSSDEYTKVKRVVQISDNHQKSDSQTPMAQHVHAVFLILHLCYEEMKLNQAFAKTLGTIAEVLAQLSVFLKLKDYTIIYLKDFPHLSSLDYAYWTNLSLNPKVSSPTWFPSSTQSMPQLLTSILGCKPSHTVYYLPDTTLRIESLVKLYSIYSSKCTSYAELDTGFLQPLPFASHSGCSQTSQGGFSETLSDCSSTEELMLLYMCARGMDQLTIDSLPFGCTLLLYEIIYSCQSDAKTSWPHSALALIKRFDIAALSNPALLPVSKCTPATSDLGEEPTRVMMHTLYANPDIPKKVKQLDGLEVLDNKILKMRWSKDLRLEEVKRCLNSNQPVKITLQQRPEVSDHQFIEQKQRHLLALCQRTMALPVGRGMLTLHCHKPALTETLHIPILCMSGKSYPTQSSVELSNDAHNQAANRLTVWPSFHNGAAAGLGLDKDAEVDTAWILYNKPRLIEKPEMNLISEHAGFLFALGINGYLNNLARLSLHDYLIKGHEMTAIGILLGLSASMRGTMDIATVRLLTIHTPSLLPPSSTRLDIAHSTKIAALVGLGLVYYSSAHRHIAGVLLHEIDHTPDIVSKGVTDDRESYSLAAGLALGMVMIGKGADMIGLHDLNIANRLNLLMTGGHRSADMSKGPQGATSRANSEQVFEGELINVDVTGAGATIALGLTYFNTKSNIVCDWLKLPQSQYLLESVRPDHLQLRTLAHALVTWETVLPTVEWVESYVPPIVAQNAFKPSGRNDNCDGIDLETHSQAYCYIISGRCFAVGLRFAGSSNKSAYDTLLFFTRKWLTIYQKPLLIEQSGRHVLENTLCTCLLSLAMVMSGSGDLEVLRLCRYLRTRIAVPLVTYGSHLAIHMALSLLFLGSGRYTLSSKPETLPLLIAAFFPRFPVHSNDNRYHLQALRHLYVQAVEPRLLLPIDIDTGEACYVPLEITFKATQYYEAFTYMTYAPKILPDLDLIKKIEICDNRYWPMKFTDENNLKCIRKLLNGRGSLAVKRRSGHFPYAVDPKGVIGAVSRAMLLNTESFASNHNSFASQHLLYLSKAQVNERSFLYLATREAISKDQSELLSVYHKLFQIVTGDEWNGTDLQQLYMLVRYMNDSRSCVVNPNLVELALELAREANCQRLNSSTSIGCLEALIEYAVDGRVPTNQDIVRHLALYSDITRCCVESSQDVNIPVLLAILHLNHETSTQLLSNRSK
ncbi:anaphase-promoting complex subunit 1-like [Watersipora subatra]|uniref:anaphase-promoting complex subunit 1-like n=1 Tax=Watersipora subatra TaxID=2589382 RepID=UPI00355C81F1